MKYPQLVSMPSAVSDWLEEQLEARGIDAVVYTRYILSLLYRDPVDIICPDQDLHFSNPGKDLRRSGGGRKRFCRSTDYAHADADQLKRSAAVECLKSASDQKCGIESLVDELCEKLKEVKSNSANTVELLEEPENSSSGSSSEPRKVTKPTTAGGGTQDPAKQYYAAFPALSSAASPNLITLIPKWFGSPKKKGPKRGQSHSSSCEEKLHLRVDAADNMKARAAPKRFNSYFGRNKGSRKPMEVSSDWDMYNNNNNWKNNRNLEAIWDGVPKEDACMYDDLPVDIKDLLESPPLQVNVEMNLANMRDNGGKKSFIQCGTNIMTSIWTADVAAPMEDFDNSYNANLDLDLKFLDNGPTAAAAWSTEVKENETNSYFETFNFEEAPWKLEKWSENDAMDNEVSNELTKSLIKINHSKESSFAEYKPKPRMFNYGQPLNPPAPVKEAPAAAALDGDKDDLLNSASSHFKPINEKVESNTGVSGQYADGTTFVIPSSLDKVSYKRSDSGLLYVEGEFGGMPKKYFEHKKVSEELTIKVRVKQNDKACQTDDDLFDCDLELAAGSGGTTSRCEDNAFYFPGDQELLMEDEKRCSCGYGSLELCSECVLGQRARADSVVAEIFGKGVLKCEKCNKNCPDNNNIWSGGEVCMECLDLVGGAGMSTEEQLQFREDIRQDWEDILSDISSIHKSNLERLPMAEVSCNINDLITGGGKEWKPLPMHSQSFSFATRLQEDCLLKLATIPTLRSVTL